MSTEVKSDTPEPVAVTEDGTNSIVHPGDAANKAVRVNVIAGLGPSGGPSAAFDAAFPASGYAAGARATAAAPSYGEGNMVALSVDLTGALRTAGGASGGGLTDTQLRASPVPVSSASLPLPAGAATEATLALVKAKTDNLDVLLSTRTKPSDTQPVSGTFWQSTQPVSVTSLPLPSNAAQETGGHLASLDTKQPALGAATTANSTPINIASDQTVPVTGAFWQTTQPVAGSEADGTTPGAANPLQIAGRVTGTSAVKTLQVDSGGRVFTRVQGGAGHDVATATGATTPLDAMLVGGSDGSALRALKTATDGTLRIDPVGTTTQPISGTVTANDQAQVAAWPASMTNGAQTALLADMGGNLRTINAEDVRQRASIEESRFIAEQSEFQVWRGRGSELRMSFIDRRGGAGQRGTIR